MCFLLSNVRADTEPVQLCRGRIEDFSYWEIHELTGVLDCFSQNVLCGRLYRHIRLLWILRVCKMPGHLRLRPKFECVSLNLQQGLRCKGCGICGNSECGEVYMY